MMRVFIVRHGESETNKAGLWTGWLDAKLTDKGYADARSVQSFLSQVSFDKVYTSDLARAVETAKTAIPDCRYETSALLREIHVGSLAKQPICVLTEEQRKQASLYGFAAFGGETKDECRNRIRQFIQGLERLDCDNVAVFSHAGWLRELFSMLVGIPFPRGKLCCNNCTVAVLEYEKGSWKLHSWINPL